MEVKVLMAAKDHLERAEALLKSEGSVIADEVGDNISHLRSQIDEVKAAA